MKTSSVNLLNKRVLILNVGFLLSAGPGNDKTIQLDITDAVKIADDLITNYVMGQIRLTRIKEGVLVQSKLTVAVNQDCARCLKAFEHAIPVEVEELYASPHPIGDTEFFIGQDAQLDLAPLLRAEILIELSHQHYCQENCQGLCTYCGTNLNHESCDCEAQPIDPRMAKLKELLDAGD